MKPYLILASILLLSGCATGPTSSPSYSQISTRFASADTNGDGVLSRDEVPSRIDFDAADANGDGALTQSELESFAMAMRSR